MHDRGWIESREAGQKYEFAESELPGPSIGTVVNLVASTDPGRLGSFVSIPKGMTMKLEYDVVEDVYDDTTQIRTMTEQARMSTGEWLIRTTVYTPHHISMDVTHVRPKEKRKSLFKPLR
jgi:hypothetical protein